MKSYQRWIWQLPEWPALAFDDGNGRLGRAILPLALGQDMGRMDAGPKGFEGGMTTRKHEQIAQTSKPTAARDLIELERLGLLTRYGDGRSTRYYPAIEGWAEDDAKLGKSSRA